MINNGIINGFINSNHNADSEFIPKLLVNDLTKNEKVLTTLIRELNKCISFKFCVAFLSDSGVQVLINTFNNLKDKSTKGIIIVSEYQYFTQPKALRRLLQFKNIELRIVKSNFNMHAKGYIFEYEDKASLIVGSSNLTQNALTLNKEWNVKLISYKEGSYYKNIINEFSNVYNNSILVNEEYLTNYEELYDNIHRGYSYISNESSKSNLITANKMQEKALLNLKQSRELGNNKALIISSTGTGDTVISCSMYCDFLLKKTRFCSII